MNAKTLLFIMALTLSVGCRGQVVQTISAEDWAETTFLRYDFTDSSTPPEYHRSYYIGIDKDSIRVRIYSYGDLLLRKVFASSQETLDNAKAYLAKQDIRKVKEGKDPMVTGGTTHSVSFFKGDDASSYFYAKAYAGVGTLYVGNGQVNEAFLKALPVSIESIIDKTRGWPNCPVVDDDDALGK